MVRCIHKHNESKVYNAMFTLHKVSLLRTCTLMLLLSKTNTNLKFGASACIAWSCMKLRLFHNLELLHYKVIKTCRRIQQGLSSWKSTREGRTNRNILKNLFVYIFTLGICKICTLQSEKNKAKQKQQQQQKHEKQSNCMRTHAPYSPPCTHLYAFGLTPSPPPLPYLLYGGVLYSCIRTLWINPNLTGHEF